MKTIKMNQEDQLSVWTMCLLALLVGVIAGFGAVLFRYIIGLVHNGMFFAKFDPIYIAVKHTARSPWGAAVILLPIIGALIVTWLTRTFAPEAKGHGVPETMDAIFFNAGKIRPIVALIKCIASAITIGSGGSVGREGPIIQIGSAFGSILGQLIKMPTRQRVVLLAAGAGAGIAATFNAPIGGMAFAVELLLVSISSSTIAVVAIATVTATHIGRYFLGIAPAFNIPALTTPFLHSQPLIGLLVFVPLGLLIGLAATLFIKMVYWTEDFLEEKIKNDYTRSIFAGGMLGLMLFLFMRYTGHYYVQGIGYATVVDILNGGLLSVMFLLVLFFAKLLATSLTLGGGGSGGVFSPSLFMGATLSAAFGLLVNHFIPQAYQLSPALYAVAGMAGMIASITGAVLTAITMLFEMTRNYSVVLPVIITISLAYLMRKKLSDEGMYTLKLLRRGKPAHEGLQAAMIVAQRARDVMTTEFGVMEHVKDCQLLCKNLAAADLTKTQILHEDGKIVGVINPDMHLVLTDEITPEFTEKVVDTNFFVVSPKMPVSQILRRMQLLKSYIVIVCEDPRRLVIDQIAGVITTRQIASLAMGFAQLSTQK